MIHGRELPQSAMRTAPPLRRRSQVGGLTPPNKNDKKSAYQRW